MQSLPQRTSPRFKNHLREVRSKRKALDRNRQLRFVRQQGTAVQFKIQLCIMEKHCYVNAFNKQVLFVYSFLFVVVEIFPRKLLVSGLLGCCIQRVSKMSGHTSGASSPYQNKGKKFISIHVNGQFSRHSPKSFLPHSFRFLFV